MKDRNKQDLKHLRKIANKDKNKKKAEAALADLTTAYRSFLQQFLFGKFKNSLTTEDIQDITQQVFIKVWEDVNSFRGEASVRWWLFGIGRQMAIDLKYKREHRRNLENERGPATTSYTITPEDEALAKMQEEEAQSAMETLSPMNQDILKKRYLSEMSYQEIAQALNIPIGTVKSRLKRAREKLRASLYGDDGTK